MSKINRETQKKLIDLLCNLGYGQAEVEAGEFLAKRFFPIKQHLKAFAPDIILIVGERGTGKSALFNAVFKNDLLEDLIPFNPELRFPYKQTDSIKFIPGYPIGANFPDQRGLNSTINTPEQAVDLWFAYLVRVLKNHLSHPNQLKFLELPGGAPDKVLSSFNKSGNEPVLVLDELDQRLQERNHWLFVGYDELDTLGGFDWETMAKTIQGLIAFWSSYSRRWNRIRAKIFVRTDLFRRHTGLGGADLAKLAANRVELVWNDFHLFSMFIKRIANTSELFIEYLKKIRIPFKKEWHSKFGFIPGLKKTDDARPLIEQMIGKYMGVDPKKGRSFNWVLDHIRDAHKCATPRALIRLFEQAADKERNNPRAELPKLLHPTSLRQALEDVSNDHVNQAINNEWPWLYGVKMRLARNRLAPWSRRELSGILDERWGESWGQGDRRISPPAQSPKELIEYLVELGVFRERSNDRIDVPDIYLFGLGLRRKGGVKKR